MYSFKVRITYCYLLFVGTLHHSPASKIICRDMFCFAPDFLSILAENEISFFVENCIRQTQRGA